MTAKAGKRNASFRSQALHWESFALQATKRRTATKKEPSFRSQTLHRESFRFKRTASFQNQAITTTTPVPETLPALQKEKNLLWLPEEAGSVEPKMLRALLKFLLYYCTTVLYYCTTVLMHYCTTIVILCYCTTVLLYYGTAVLLYSIVLLNY